MRTVYVNGSYLPENEASISIFDRGFLFGDGVYEVTLVLDGKLIDFPGHMARLHRSLGELDIALTLSESALLEIHQQLLAKNDLVEGLVYLQVTRGAADRDFVFPTQDMWSSVVLFTQAKNILQTPLAKRGLRVVTMDDLRWQRCDIKTVQLLYSSLAKVRARADGADDVWMVKEGFVTEGSSSNAYIVTRQGKIITRPLSHDILHGITREAVLQCAAELGLEFEERKFTVEEAKQAVEAFSTSASSLVQPVVKIDEKAIGSGKPGPTTTRLREIYLQRSKASAI